MVKPKKEKQERITIGFSVTLDAFIEIHNIVDDSKKVWRYLKGETKRCLKGDVLLYLMRHGQNVLNELKEQKEANKKLEGENELLD